MGFVVGLQEPEKFCKTPSHKQCVLSQVPRPQYPPLAPVEVLGFFTFLVRLLPLFAGT
jgi:hypothetical protein